MARRRGKRSRPLLTLAFALAAALAVYLVLVNYVFVIRKVEVTGTSAYSPEDAIRLAQIPLGRPLGQLDPERVRRALESTGALAFESVATRLPDTVLLAVHERTIDALVQNAGTVLALDSEGCVVGQYAELPDESAVYVTGLNVQHFALGSPVGADPQALRDMTAVLKGLKAVDAEALISELNVADSQQLYLYSRTGIQVVLGSGEDMERKLQWTKSALLDLESRGETKGRLDVSSGNKADFLPQ